MTSHAVVLRPSQIRHLLRVTEATSRHPERDALILLLGITCGMRVTEIARVEIADVVAQSGAIRTEVSLRAAITKGSRQRCVYLTHEKTRTALERYLALRISRQLGTSLDDRAYRGLIASNRLILTHKGTAYELSLKRRTNGEGGQVGYWAADSLQSYVTGLYRAAGLRRGYSSHSGRRTFANRLLAQGESLETVQTLLGHAELDHVMSYLDDDPARIRAALEAFSADFMPDHDDA
ncbi:integrase [Paraburkholderia phytofirmans OLGA172]|uniref:Integrase n=1 Tax=Paraburkholderia phytofirmans OLGA172 TaxID=1417228 RepID=A0A160FJT1_9BURK|nr:site-specific integrase [Paraburkholderia phytofirmans]ANB72630.1 integrase [Paraburkholderia phytofirmans OLGA172]